MWKYLDRGAAQSRSIDDARVIELVGNDDVVFRENRRDRAGIGGEAALEYDDRFGLLERGEPLFEFQMDGHRARNRANRTGADTEGARRFERALAQSRVDR